MAKRQFIWTPYQATKIMNAHRAELGLKPVKSPFMYIQASKGRFEIIESADGRKQIADPEQFLAWVIEHNTRQVGRKATKEDTETVERLAICA
jgi:hypothetical protein